MVPNWFELRENKTILRNNVLEWFAQLSKVNTQAVLIIWNILNQVIYTLNYLMLVYPIALVR